MKCFMNVQNIYMPYPTERRMERWFVVIYWKPLVHGKHALLIIEICMSKSGKFNVDTPELMAKVYVADFVDHFPVLEKRDGVY